MPFAFYYTPEFGKDVKHLKKRYRRIDDDIRELIADMKTSEYRGDMISGVGTDVYKVRLSNRSARRGRRGGFRALYFHDREDRFVFFHIYSKSDKNDAGSNEIRTMLRDLL